MSSITPTVGRIVLFKLAAHNAGEINRRRQHARNELDYHRWKKNGTMIHVGNDVSAGDVFPAVVVRVWGTTPESAINIKVMLDGSDDYWATSVHVGDKDGDYHWMPYQIGQAAKHAAEDKSPADVA